MRALCHFALDTNDSSARCLCIALFESDADKLGEFVNRAWSSARWTVQQHVKMGCDALRLSKTYRAQTPRHLRSPRRQLSDSFRRMGEARTLLQGRALRWRPSRIIMVVWREEGKVSGDGQASYALTSSWQHGTENPWGRFRDIVGARESGSSGVWSVTGMQDKMAGCKLAIMTSPGHLQCDFVTLSCCENAAQEVLLGSNCHL